MNQIIENMPNLNSPSYYNNRELSWLAFNKRVLEEAFDTGNPLLERFKFLAIFSSNLDEFFMVRVAGIKDQIKVGFNKPENKAGMTPKQQIREITDKTHDLVELQYKTLNTVLLPELAEENIEFVTISQLTDNQLKEIDEYFEEQIFPVLTPLAVDAYRPFPMLLSKSLNIAVVIEDFDEPDENRLKTAIVQVPAVLDRFVKVTSDTPKVQLLLLEDIISHFIGRLFSGHTIVSISTFRITRNADLTIHEDGADDLLKEIEKELKKRKSGAAVRLEIKQQGFDNNLLRYLLEELEIHEADVYHIDGPLDLTSLFSLYKKLANLREHLTYETLIPQTPKDLASDQNIFEKVATQDVFLHHPYESFEPVVDFVANAADDPDVLAIKQTLYRVSGGSPIIEALKRAAEKGKQVTVLVELKARFDEENNVQWAKELEEAGCHVIYGMIHLKTHSKITLVVRRKNNKIERFVHLGTGNYNDQTAKLYTDMGLFTSNKDLGIDATHFFNFLSGYTEKPDFRYLSVAPFSIRQDLIQLIDEEIALHRQHKNGRIVAKMNSLTDKLIIMKLYEASIAGVQIDLIIRGICCLRPGIKDVSENIKVRSIVGRFLEHSRIYQFYHNGEEKTFLSSADLMTRNMEDRIEILFPVLDARIKARINAVLALELADNVKAREQDEFGQYHYVARSDEEPKIESQLVMSDQAYKSAAAGNASINKLESAVPQQQKKQSNRGFFRFFKRFY